LIKWHFYLTFNRSLLLTINNWLREITFYSNLRLSLSAGESILDPGGFHERIWQASSNQDISGFGSALNAYVIGDGTPIASTSTDGILIADGDVWRGVGDGLMHLVGGVIYLLGIGSYYMVLNQTGQVTMIVFHATTGGDNSRVSASQKLLTARVSVLARVGERGC
jgi:hypothetical protein